MSGPPDYAELRAVWKAAEANGTFGAFVRLALLTGQRRSVLLNMRWSDLNGDNGDVWTIPQTDAREKGNAKALRLPRQTMAILERLPRFKGNPYVFAGRGGKPIAGISGLKAKLDKASGVSDWTVHDLRRTADHCCPKPESVAMPVNEFWATWSARKSKELMTSMIIARKRPMACARWRA